jgi:hypothetical protein
MAAVRSGVDLGASHGIGHQLGPLGVGHGETSCILLPAVSKYNVKANQEQQTRVKEILLEEREVRHVLSSKGLQEDHADLGDLLDAFISELGMPRSLISVGVGRDKLNLLAKNSLSDKWCHTNPVPLEDEAQVLEILEMVIG